MKLLHIPTIDKSHFAPVYIKLSEVFGVGDITVDNRVILITSQATYFAEFNDNDSADNWRTNLLRLLAPNKQDIINLDTSRLVNYDDKPISDNTNEFVELNSTFVRLSDIVSVSSLEQTHFVDTDNEWFFTVYMQSIPKGIELRFDNQDSAKAYKTSLMNKLIYQG